jgi:hypothetical protein
MTQNNLGAALQVLGERGDDGALHRAVAAYEAALEEYTRERAPLAWAMMQNNLGPRFRRSVSAAMIRYCAAPSWPMRRRSRNYPGTTPWLISPWLQVTWRALAIALLGPPRCRANWRRLAHTRAAAAF